MKKNAFLIAGKHTVEEALKNPKRKVIKVYITEDAKKIINKDNQPKNLFKGVSIVYRSRKELDNLSGNQDIVHQGVLAEIEDLESLSLKDFVKNVKKNNLNLIALDGVTDPRNIGSIVRTVASFEFDGLIVKERSFPSKSKLLYKSASGSVEHINIFKVSNLNTTLSFLKKNNFWVSAFDSRAEKDFVKHNWSGKNVLLFGSEGEGLREKTLSKADFKFKIKISNKIESLNISNTVSIVCHFIKNQIN